MHGRMARSQCIVHRQNRSLMVKHRQGDEEWLCLPGGGVEGREEPSAAAKRELKEECMVEGTIIRQMSFVSYAPDDQTHTFLVDIGEQEPTLGADPDVPMGREVLAEVKWLSLAEIPERDRAFLWAGGLLGIPEFFAEVEAWGPTISCPSQEEGIQHTNETAD